MKKGLLFVAVIAAFSFASCKKDRTCVCTTGSSASTVTYTKISKSDAKDACLETRTSINGNSTTTTTCTLN